MPDWDYRDVVEESRFTQDVDGYRRIYSRMDVVLGWISWELARTPYAGTPLPNFPDFRVLRTKSVQGTPAFRVLYSFDSEKVYLHAISEIKADENDS